MRTATVVVPTYKRETELGVCLESVLSQSVLPAEILVIDDDAVSEAFLTDWRARCAARGVSFRYRRKNHAVERRGLSESKNLALVEATGEIVFFFDDDVILHPGFLAAVMAEWNGPRGADPALLGVGGLISNARPSNALERAFNALFGLTGECAWDVNPVAYTVWDEGIVETVKGYYLHGGVSSYRRAEAAKLGFATFSGGRTALEDLDFCLSAKRRGYHFLIVPAAKVLHNHSPVSREAEYLIGVKDSLNRREIYSRLGLHGWYGRAWFAWAGVGWVLRLVLGLRFSGAAGRVAGFLQRRPA